MIIKPANHYFEATYPVLEDHEEIIWFRHPKHPVQCNQVGMIVFDDDVNWAFNGRDQYRYWTDRKGNSKVLGSPERVVSECYTGISHKSQSFLYRDGNPYNRTYQNLIPYRVINTAELKEANYKWKAFLKASVDYMNTRTPVLEKRGIVPAEYWALMELPDWLTKVWARGQEMPKTKLKKMKERDRPPRSAPYVIKPWKLERAALIHKLRKEGKTQMEIAHIVGLRTNSAVSHWLKNYPDPEDI